MATIYDVAKVAGVSPKTVSRVINGDAPVGETTREKVEAAIAQLGYIPSNAARMMRSNRSGLIGLITGAISRTPELVEPKGLPDLFIVQGIQQVIASRDLTLMIADTGGRVEKVPSLIRTFQQHRVEGLIYVADHHKKVAFEAATQDCPLVLANCYDGAGTPAVLPDDRTCQRALVERLIAHGHRRIAYLTLDRVMDATALRIEGYREALEAAGIPFDPDLVGKGYELAEDAEHRCLDGALDRLLQLPERPTVICCGNDEMAMRLYGLLRTRGIRVPEEISVAGFDNYRAIAETLFPSLSTVELPYAEMGRRAAELLLSLIAKETPRPSTPVRVAGRVFWRSSVIDLEPESQTSKGG
ncbi:LacI family DNA-binding transcriptional regulator [Thioclava atlantica]|uniref:Regulatory protein LacI n=1 Tax=Thioclava atlantica TaxID=1317124 RepID=A0A085TZX9_9RHOB|nr:LacI family DNA-binding transcriptional regulator [Thioclava atlantica]KFE36276.1 regulatory protein LacI [Thioclava atlantica]